MGDGAAQNPQVHAPRQALGEGEHTYAIAIEGDGTCGHHGSLSLKEGGPLRQWGPQASVGVDAESRFSEVLYLAVDLGRVQQVVGEGVEGHGGDISFHSGGQVFPGFLGGALFEADIVHQHPPIHPRAGERGEVFVKLY